MMEAYDRANLQVQRLNIMGATTNHEVLIGSEVRFSAIHSHTAVTTTALAEMVDRREEYNTPTLSAVHQHSIRTITTQSIPIIRPRAMFSLPHVRALTPTRRRTITPPTHCLASTCSCPKHSYLNNCFSSTVMRDEPGGNTRGSPPGRCAVILVDSNNEGSCRSHAQPTLVAATAAHQAKAAIPVGAQAAVGLADTSRSRTARPISLKMSRQTS